MKPTIEKIRTYADQLIGTNREATDYETAVVLLSAIFYGTNSTTLSELTGCPLARVEEISQRMRASLIWSDTAVDCGYWGDEKYGHLSFLMDLQVAEGLLQRTQQKNAKGNYVYKSLIHEGSFSSCSSP
jgi:hypothetical protein